MDLRILGCHGGETPNHRTTSFLIDEKLAIDAGALTGTLLLNDQGGLDSVLVTHAHLDHVRDLATLADNRAQLGCGPLTVIATGATIKQLKKHFFNGVLWPDFSVIPTPTEPTIVYEEIELGVPKPVLGYTIEAVKVSHTIDTAGFIISGGFGALGISGDTGPTEKFWERLNATENLRSVLMEVSFPNDQQALATASGHHTPQTLETDLLKLTRPDVPTMLYHIKPPFQGEVERECARLKGFSLEVVNLDDEFLL